jgi:hypothetical protein
LIVVRVSGTSVRIWFGPLGTPTPKLVVNNRHRWKAQLSASRTFMIEQARSDREAARRPISSLIHRTGCAMPSVDLNHPR